jgi:hypothetical protein
VTVLDQRTELASPPSSFFKNWNWSPVLFSRAGTGDPVLFLRTGTGHQFFFRALEPVTSSVFLRTGTILYEKKSLLNQVSKKELVHGPSSKNCELS